MKTPRLSAKCAVLLVMMISSYSFSEENKSNVILAWNDDCGAIWNVNWGGEDVKSWFEPKISKLEAYNGSDARKFIEDTYQWLGVLMNERLMTRNMLNKITSVSSCIGSSTGGNAKIRKITSFVEDIKRRPDDWCNPKDELKKEVQNTSGNIVKFETEKYIVQIVDRARQVTILLRDKEGGILPTIRDRVDWLFRVRKDLFRDDVLLGDRKTFSIVQIKEGKYWIPVSGWMELIPIKAEKDYDVVSVILRHNKGKNEGSYAYVYRDAIVKLYPEPVATLVFYKILRATLTSTAYFPRSRFEDVLLFENQKISNLREKGVIRLPRPGRGSISRKKEGNKER